MHGLAIGDAAVGAGAQPLAKFAHPGQVFELL